ncbi:glycosyl hydrolase family 8 [Methylomonas sp. MgM2]
MMSIRQILIFIGFVLIAAGCEPHNRIDHQDWQTYKTRFVASEGRLIDTGNGGISHSEGQGYGMLLAVAHDDRDTFQNIWQWTRANLQIRNDKLFIWRKRPNVALKDEDPNDASDGDMLIAWALLQASRKWQRPDYQTEALAILADIKAKLIVPWHGLVVILPGEQGFAKPDATIINLSYWIYPALQAFDTADPDPIWRELTNSGMTLLQKARFGRWQLPPDWLRLSERDDMEPAKDQRFGYDAVRIPLYLMLAHAEPQTLSTFADYWGFYQAYTPAWIGLNENCLDSYGASPGMVAIKHLALSRAGREQAIAPPALSDDQDYYSSTLLLLSRLAARAD